MINDELDIWSGLCTPETIVVVAETGAPSICVIATRRVRQTDGKAKHQRRSFEEHSGTDTRH